MKQLIRFILCIVAVALCTNASAAEVIDVHMQNGLLLCGELVTMTDSTLEVIPDYSPSRKHKLVSATDVKRFTLGNNLRYTSIDGRFVIDPKSQKKLDQITAKQNSRSMLVSSATMHTPYDVQQSIGKALKSTGAIGIGLGVPSLFVGTILMAYGYTNGDNMTPAQAKAKANCATAACVLMPIGASLTIIGIPLYVHGKRIMDLNVNYTGNGAGLSLAF